MKSSPLRTSLFALFLLILLLSSCAFAEQPQDDPAYLPGDQLHGFTLVSEQALVSPSALVHLWQHDKTGAQVYFFHNDDQERTFSIAFRTEPSDNTGKLHILEHAVCSASEKYPGRDVFYDASSQAYITSINAATYKSATSYYVSSMSEDQLERMADFYLDCAFNSALRSEPNYFLREGWRLSLPDAASPLTIDGIVYNEMKGIFGSIYEKHYCTGLENALFPDTYQRWDSGGLPESIPDLTYEALIDFYNTCYHPSNSISMFYGDVETERYLKLMDEAYFSLFDRQSAAGYSPGQAAFSEAVVFEQDFPVSADSSQTGSVISFAVVLPEGVSFAEIQALAAGAEYLGDASFPLMEALYDSDIGAGYYAEYTFIGTQFVLLFTADDADPSRAEEFKSIVLESLSAMVADGFDQETLDSIFGSQQLSMALASNQSHIGETLASRLASAVDSGYMELLDPSAQHDDVYALSMQGGLEALLTRYVLSNTHAALVITTPKPGLLEAEEQKTLQALADQKAALSPEELQALIDETAAFQRWNDESGSIPETLDKFRTETPEAVPATLPDYGVKIADLNGAALLTAQVESDVSMNRYLFDLSHLNLDELRALNVYIQLLGRSTELHSQRALSIAQRSLLAGLSAELSATTRADGSVYPSLMLEFYATDEHLSDAAALVMEMFRHTDLRANAVHLEAAISGQIQNHYDAEFLLDSLAFSAALSASSDVNALLYTVFGKDYCAALDSFAEMEETALFALLESVREKALVREGASVITIGSAAGKHARSEALCALLPESAAPQTTGDWAQALSQSRVQSTAFVCDSASSHMRAAVNAASLGLAPTGELILLTDILADAVLLPEFRFQLGAYGVSLSMKATGDFRFMLYRSPSYREAIDRLKELPADAQAFLETMTPQDLAGYQLARLSSETCPSGPWNDAATQAMDCLEGRDPALRQTLIDQIRTATPETLIAALPQLQQLIDAMSYAVVAPATAIDAHAALFESVIQVP